MKNKMVLAVLMIVLMLLSGCRLYTVVPMEVKTEEGLVADQSDKDFDADAYAMEIWPQVEEYTAANAAKIEDVVALYNDDKEKCIDAYCLTEVGEADTARFLVYGRVMILNVNRDSKVGRMEVDIAPYDGVADVIVQVGPVYKKNAVRDSMPFIIFEDFMNQLAFGDAGKAINKYIDTYVVVPEGIDDKIGIEIDLLGVFEEGDEIVVTPVLISDAE